MSHYSAKSVQIIWEVFDSTQGTCFPYSPRQLVQESKDAKEGTDAAARKAGQTSS